MFSVRTLSIVLVAGFALSRPDNVLAIAGTDRVASPGQLLTAEEVAPYEWPRGALEVANHPLRGDIWHPWFSEWPNDNLFCEMNVRNNKDVNDLIDLMKKVKSLKRQIILRPGRGAPPLAFTERQKDVDGAGAVFQIGSQARIDQWYEHLAEIRPGVKGFGKIEYEKVPECQPPTLVLYVQHPGIQFEKLEIPLSIQVKVEIDATFRKDEANREVIERMNDFVARNKSRQEASKPKAKGSPE